MHILFLSDNFPPEVNAPASRTFEHCRDWVRAGHRVTVVTCAPNFPTGKVFEGYRNRLWSVETVDGIRVVRVWSFITANEGFAARTLDYISYMVSAVVAAPFVRRVDLVIATSPQFFTACAGYLVSRFKRRPFVFELRDIWPESIRAVGAIRGEWILKLLERIELFLYRHAAAVISVTNAFRENLARRGIDRGKIFVITNGADLTRFAPLPKDLALCAQYGLAGKFVLGYIGTHGMAHALETILDAAQTIQRTPEAANVHFLFLGDGANKAALVARAREMGLENVTFVGTVSKNDVTRYWSLLDVSIIHLKKTELFTTVIPSKLFEAMAMGVPVLHGVGGESADIVTREDAGLLFEPENVPMLVDGISRLAKDEKLRERLSRNGCRAAMKYDRSKLARQMLTILESLANQGRSRT